jgi:hypothetical protein
MPQASAQASDQSMLNVAVMNDMCTGMMLMPMTGSCTYNIVFNAPAPPPDGGTGGNTLSGTTSVTDGTAAGSASAPLGGTY